MMRLCLLLGAVTLRGGLSKKKDAAFVADDKSIRVAVREWVEDRVNAETKYGQISKWDTSEVTSFFCLFSSDSGNCGSKAISSPGWSSGFNDDISAWDTRSVTTTARMFDRASSFNQPIGKWKMNKVTDTSFMFDSGESFDQSLKKWDVSKVTTMERMFQHANSFNQDLSKWDVGKVTNMQDMFDGADKFDQNLGWCVSDGCPSGGCTQTDEKYLQALKDTVLFSAFTKTKCEKTSCGVVQGNVKDKCSSKGSKGSSSGSIKRKPCKSAKKDKKSWTYDAGSNGLQSCKHVEGLPAKRCARIGKGGLPALDACCMTCAPYKCKKFGGAGVECKPKKDKTKKDK